MVHEEFLDRDRSSDEGVEIPVEFEDEADKNDFEDSSVSDQGEEESGACPDSEEEPEEAADQLKESAETSKDEADTEADAEEPADHKEDEAEETADSEEEAEEAGEAGDNKEEETKTAADQAEDSGESEKHGIFGFKKKDKEKEKLQNQLKDLNDRLLRNMAEFDNFRKRTEREKSAMYGMGAEDMAKKMLPIVDSFERGLAQTPEDTSEGGNPIVEGMRMIYKQMLTALEEAGVEPIEAVGKEFDPNIHNAVMHVDDEEAGDNVVVEEFQKGYTYKGNVIRHSMVKVAN